jgi:hypothetical protein
VNRLLLLGIVFSSWAMGCGARTGLWVVDEKEEEVPPPTPECSLESPCPGSENLCLPVKCRLPEGVCEKLPEVICDDLDPCTEDQCLPESGQCLFEPLTFDLDGDGFKGPRPGFAAGEPGSSGDDCDDTTALAHPGAEEICDGVDNDRKGIIEDGASFIPADT